MTADFSVQHEFWNDLHYEDIHFRDVWQIELQSDFAYQVSQKQNVVMQEFYIFIPRSLQINKENYPQEDFYRDRTSLIRFKTPEFTLQELLLPTAIQSPFIRIKHVSQRVPNKEDVDFVDNELKLLGNVVRSSLRTSTRMLVDALMANVSVDGMIERFCEEIRQFRHAFLQVKGIFKKNWRVDTIDTTFAYVDEFISSSIDYYCLGLLATVRQCKSRRMHHADVVLVAVIREEQTHRQREYGEKEVQEDNRHEEAFLYRRGLLNKFVLDALLLTLQKTSWIQKYGFLIGTIAAGLAMLVYVAILFFTVTVGRLFVINSVPFLLLTVVIYVLKDRIKEGIRALFHREGYKWFADYTTKIMNSSSKRVIGKLKESTSFVDQADIPDEIIAMRHAKTPDIPLLQQHEEVIYYKKEMIFTKNPALKRSRRKHVHNIFLFNLQSLLQKASNAMIPVFLLDETNTLKEQLFPKVYYITIIVKHTTRKVDGEHVEIKKFSVCVDKRGIKRVEHIATKH